MFFSVGAGAALGVVVAVVVVVVVVDVVKGDCWPLLQAANVPIAINDDPTAMATRRLVGTFIFRVPFVRSSIATVDAGRLGRRGRRDDLR
jgi:hypothetical protein